LAQDPGRVGIAMAEPVTPEERREWMLDTIDKFGRRYQETKGATYWRGYLNALYRVAVGLEGMDESIVQKHIKKYTFPEDFDLLAEEE